MDIVQMKLDGIGLELFWYQKNADAPALQLDYANALDQLGVKHIALRVSDADQALNELIALGYADEQTEIHTARSLNNSRYFFIQDPDGMWVELMEDNMISRMALN